MSLTVDRNPTRPRRNWGDVLFPAHDARGRPLTIAVEETAWRSIADDRASDPLLELEELALTGGWEAYGSGRVWRVTLI